MVEVKDLPTINQVEQALDLRMQIGDVTELTTEATPDPLGYIAAIGEEIHLQLTGEDHA